MAPNNLATKGFKATRDGGLMLYPSVAVDSVKHPDVDTQNAAGFGNSISDVDRAFAASREPICHFLTYGVAADITEKWFTVDDPDTEEADPALDRGIQKAFHNLDFKKHLTDAVTQARIYKKSLLVCGFNDAKTTADLKNELRKGSELLQVAVYPKTFNELKNNDYTVDVKDENPESPRFGQPVIYKVDRGMGNYLYVHYTRCFELDYTASVLDCIWDDVTCGRNIRWGAAQWMYRTGGGFPVLGFPAGTKVDQLEAWCESGAFDNLMSRTYIAIAQNSVSDNDGMTFEFKGAAGHTLDPVPFFKSNIEQIAIATGIPQAKLVGAQAGAVTGSDVNMQDYYKVVSREQSRLDTCIRWFIAKLAASGQISYIKQAETDGRHKTVQDYTINWVSAFELSDEAEAQVELARVQANVAKLDYMTVDEVRQENHLKPLPNGEGAQLKQNSLGLFGEKEKQDLPEGEEEPAEAGDKFLVVDLNKTKKRHRHVQRS